MREAQRSFRPNYQGCKGEQIQGQRPQDIKRKIFPTLPYRQEQGKRPRIGQEIALIATNIPLCSNYGKFHPGE